MTSEVSKEVFLRDFGRELAERNATLFIGAGLSRPAGFVDWRDLLREIASDLGLDVDRETDLLSVAQFHENQAGNRGKLNQALLDEFTKGATPTRNHTLLASLPVESIWTTNYDTLIEDSLKSVGRRPDVKHSAKQLAGRVRGADVTVLKMHGDISMADEAVLTRDDYEEYGKTRQLFSEKLQGDLVSQTFLFLGFSFTDPNIDYILSRIRVLLGRGVRNHFCLMKRPTPPGGHEPAIQAEYDYEVRRLELRMQDLKRYGIQTVLLDDYAEITTLLEELNRASHAREVFVSGSAHDYGSMGQAKVEELCRKLGNGIINAGLNLVNGFGLGIGGAVSMSAIEAVYNKDGERLESRVLLRPFPQTPPEKTTIQELWAKYRQDMISQAGHAVFLCGNKLDIGTGEIVEANGVHQEFLIAQAQGKTLIPVGATGFVAKELWQRVSSDLATFFPKHDVAEEFVTLGSEGSSADELVAAILSIIRKTSR